MTGEGRHQYLYNPAAYTGLPGYWTGNRHLYPSVSGSGQLSSNSWFYPAI